jgi:hypothetical protein
VDIMEASVCGSVPSSKPLGKVPVKLDARGKEVSMLSVTRTNVEFHRR